MASDEHPTVSDEDKSFIAFAPGEAVGSLGLLVHDIPLASKLKKMIFFCGISLLKLFDEIFSPSYLADVL